MQEINRTARELHLMYRLQADRATESYNQLRTDFPTGEFPKHAKIVWQKGTLAYTWGKIATALSGGKVDYIAEWRAGKFGGHHAK